MTSAEFLKILEPKLADLGASKNEDGYFVIETILGHLRIRLDPNARLKLYSVFFRFTEKEKFNYHRFVEIFSKFENINSWSLKWNIHNSDPNFIIKKVIERLEKINSKNNI